MSKDPFLILGVDRNVTQNQLFDAYRSLRDKYSNQRFEPGEKGAEACRKLEEIEEAYRQASDILKSNFDISFYGEGLKDVEDAIKEGDLEKAQDLLDSVKDRTARWHYLQSVIFYRRGWLKDALKQLEFACNLEPDNAKYAEAKENLSKKIYSDYSFYRNDGERSYRDTPPQPMARGCTPCDCCAGLLCADCCCNCTGGC